MNRQMQRADAICNSDEENGRHACMNGHLTTADQSEICEAYLVSVNVIIRHDITCNKDN